MDELLLKLLPIVFFISVFICLVFYYCYQAWKENELRLATKFELTDVERSRDNPERSLGNYGRIILRNLSASPLHFRAKVTDYRGPSQDIFSMPSNGIHLTPANSPEDNLTGCVPGGGTLPIDLFEYTFSSGGVRLRFYGTEITMKPMPEGFIYDFEVEAFSMEPGDGSKTSRWFRVEYRNDKSVDFKMLEEPVLPENKKKPGIFARLLGMLYTPSSRGQPR